MKTKEVGWGTRDRTWDLLIQRHMVQLPGVPLEGPCHAEAIPLIRHDISREPLVILCCNSIPHDSLGVPSRGTQNPTPSDDDIP